METKTGGCHCGKVRYTVEIDLSKPVIECNCSHCQIKGLLLAFVPESVFKITAGEENLAEYRFNTTRLRHLFCKTCGVESFCFGADSAGNATAAVNVRTIDDIDLSTLVRMPYNGRDI
jgi:hypothetical protein